MCAGEGRWRNLNILNFYGRQNSNYSLPLSHFTQIHGGVCNSINNFDVTVTLDFHIETKKLVPDLILYCKLEREHFLDDSNESGT